MDGSLGELLDYQGQAVFVKIQDRAKGGQLRIGGIVEERFLIDELC